MDDEIPATEELAQAQLEDIKEDEIRAEVYAREETNRIWEAIAETNQKMDSMIASMKPSGTSETVPEVAPEVTVIPVTEKESNEDDGEQKPKSKRASIY